jgi:hypothetical protein
MNTKTKVEISLSYAMIKHQFPTVIINVYTFDACLQARNRPRSTASTISMSVPGHSEMLFFSLPVLFLLVMIIPHYGGTKVREHLSILYLSFLLPAWHGDCDCLGGNFDALGHKILRLFCVGFVACTAVLSVRKIWVGELGGNKGGRNQRYDVLTGSRR